MCVLKYAGSEFTLNVGTQPSELKHVIYQNILSFLCFVFVCSFFVFIHFSPSGVCSPLFFVLNCNLICDFSYRYLLSYLKVEEFKNNFT